ncbi:MAG: heme biosynthesis protein HemY [Aestuariivirga sp.]
MIRLLWRFGLLVLAAILFAWMADRPGSLTLRWLDREIETSLVVALTGVLLLMAALWFLWTLFRRLWRSPRTAREYWRFRKSRKGYESLSRGIVAAGAGDSAGASKHAGIAASSLTDEPLVNVLAAQAAQLRGDRNEVRRIFADMAKSPATEALGLRGLFAEARQAGDMTAAMAHAERALKLNPRLAWASTAMLQLQSGRKDWQAAANTLAQQAKSGLLKDGESAPKQAAMLAAHALSLEDSNRSAAIDAALKAHKLDPSLVPAALVAARVHIADGSARRAAKILRATWALSPHPDIAAVFGHQSPGDGPEARFEKIRDLVTEKPGVEGDIALAMAAVAAKRWDVARDALSSYIRERPQERICALMAEIEEASGDKGRAREWLARALRAPRDPMWVSDGVASPRWTPVSPVTGEIVPCEWKVPFEMLGETEPEAAPQTPPGPEATAPALIEKPRKVEAARPPDDPGLPAG